MNPYSAEKLLLEQHRHRVAQGERLASLLADDEMGSVSKWAAGRLRALADRLDRPPLAARGVVKHLRID